MSDSPLLETVEGKKTLKIKFNVSDFKPEEIIVKTVDDKLMVHAKHQTKTEGHSEYRELNREIQLPKGVSAETIKSTLSRDGILSVVATVPENQS